ncbi:SDR family oxidoreductase [Acinetobacter sp. ME22]|uniref:SDR family oxidoreductase n=1 Tax=Acinetobacter sp. ME22 TaxID=2904802 RepID=UPI001EDC1BA6|nr:SDR family oxidoreductase [Acinetobacter sp. ME22]MCG2574128.1 SDR family oxidoreductase [Acinetobacter sp. ME22]
MSSLKQQKVLILGGTSGFGLAVAKLAIAEQAQVSITGRNAEKLQHVVTELQAQSTLPVAGYVFDAYQIGAATILANELGQYDHIISTVGHFMGGGFLEASYDSIIQAVAEKFNANLAIAQAFAAHLNVGGSFIFTAGSGGKLYNASGAIIGNQNLKALVQGLAVELAPQKRVNAVSPTWTETPLWREFSAEQVEQMKQGQAANIPLQRTATIDEVASAYLFLMQNGFITGQTIAVDGGVDLR